MVLISRQCMTLCASHRSSFASRASPTGLGAYAHSPESLKRNTLLEGFSKKRENEDALAQKLRKHYENLYPESRVTVKQLEIGNTFTDDQLWALSHDNLSVDGDDYLDFFNYDPSEFTLDLSMLVYQKI